MAQQALESMTEDAKKMGQKLKNEETKNIVLSVLDAAFLLISFIGEAARALTRITMIPRAPWLVGLAGSTGIGIYDAEQILRWDRSPFWVFSLV
jgi:hypothetical protein